MNNFSRNSLDNKLRKKKLWLERKISCDRCPFNKKENANTHKPKDDKYKNIRKGRE